MPLEIDKISRLIAVSRVEEMVEPDFDQRGQRRVGGNMTADARIFFVLTMHQLKIAGGLFDQEVLQSCIRSGMNAVLRRLSNAGYLRSCSLSIAPKQTQAFGIASAKINGNERSVTRLYPTQNCVNT